MNSSYELWQTTYQWLSDCGNKISKKYLKEELTTHPDYPALVSLSDFLELGNFSYMAVQADTSHINKFNYPLLAHIKKPGQDYLQIISNSKVWDKEISKNWSGIVLYPMPESKWENTQNSIFLKDESISKAIIFLIIFFTILACFYISYHFLSSILLIVLGFLSVAGVIISIILVGLELGYKSKVVKQVCGVTNDDGCEKVLKSNYAKGYLGITPADASLLYFYSQLTLFLISTVYKNYLSLITLFTMFGFLIAIWSIYIQAIKIKEYCALCLSIVAILLFQILISSFVYKTTLISELYNSSTLASGMLLYLFISIAGFMILIPIKNLIKIKKQYKEKSKELKRWKLDADLFVSLWKQEQLVDINEMENDLILGNSEAHFSIIIVCNLYCGPCASTHKKIDEILNKYENLLKIKIRLLCDPYNSSDIRTIASIKILQKSLELDDPNSLKNMFNDWFRWMNLEKWNSKWGPNKDVDVENILVEHENWIKESLVTHTPTIFINGRKLPSRYKIDDFLYLLPQLLTIVK